MKPIKVKYKKVQPDAFDPERGTEGSAGLDLRGLTPSYHLEKGYVSIDTGLAFEIPKGHAGLLFPRSSISNTPHFLRNGIGLLDEDFRGSVSFRFGILDGINTEEYGYGDKIGQLVVVELPKVELEEVTELDDTQRGTGGYGSTGK